MSENGSDCHDCIILYNNMSLQILIEVNKEKSDGLNTEDFHYAISRAPDFARYCI